VKGFHSSFFFSASSTTDAVPVNESHAFDPAYDTLTRGRDVRLRTVSDSELATNQASPSNSASCVVMGAAVQAAVVGGRDEHARPDVLHDRPDGVEGLRVRAGAGLCSHG
jgi:hypothetical protein